MIRHIRSIYCFIAIPLLAIAGYAIMHALVVVSPMDQDTTGLNLVVTILIIALGLAVPYWMLKAGVGGAHERNPAEKPLALKDIPKDHEQLDNE